MCLIRPGRVWIPGLAFVLAGLCTVTLAQELEKPATWAPTNLDTVMEWVHEWEHAANIQSTLSVTELNSAINQDPEKVLGFSLVLLSELFPFAADAIELLGKKPVDTADWKGIVDPTVLSDPRLPESAVSQLRLATGCWFARHERFDEALDMLEPLSIDQVVAPARLLFYRGMAQHRLLQSEKCLQSLNRLMENEELIPRRFAVISKLMISDITTLEEDSMDEISRMMDDIRRRQALHRSGTRVIDQEKKVIEKLEQMIEDIEKQMQQSAGSAAAKSGSSQPMQESRNAGGKGSGDATERPLDGNGHWGSLPPQKRAAALAEMSRDLPPHYREVIEEYFRQLAREPRKDR